MARAGELSPGEDTERALDGPARAAAEARLAEAIASREACCAVVGLGFVGATWMDALLAAGFATTGFDRSPEAVARRRGALREPGGATGAAWDVVADAAPLAGAQVVLVAVRALVGGDGRLDLEPLRSAATALGPHLGGDRLVILVSTLGPGTTRRFASEWLPAADAPLRFVAHAPERLAVGHGLADLVATPHVVGGIGAAATRLAGGLISAVGSRPVPVSSPEVSELTKLLENASRTVGIALVSEVAELAQRLGVEASEVSAAAASKPFGYLPFHPGPGVGGHCLPNDLAILRSAADGLGLATPVLDAAGGRVREMPARTVDRLAALLAERGEALASARVVLVGVGFKPGSADTAGSPAVDVARRLRERGATPVFLDPRVSALAVDGRGVERVTAEALRPGAFAAAVILAGDPELREAELTRAVGLVLDTRPRASTDPRPDGVRGL